MFRQLKTVNTIFFQRQQGLVEILRCRNLSTQIPAKKAREFYRPLGMLAFLSVAAGTGCLGYWQLKRRVWKTNLIEYRTQRLNEEPVDLQTVLPKKASDNIDEIEVAKDTLDYRRVLCQGIFDYDNEVFVGPRSSPDSDSSKQRRGKGYFAITPMTLKPSGHIIWINRGWIADESLKTSVERSIYSDNEVSIVGVVRDGEMRPQYLTAGDVEQEALHMSYLSKRVWLDIDSMNAAYAQKQKSSSPILLLDALEPLCIKYPTRKNIASYVEFHSTPTMHAVYAGTWFSVSVIICAMTFMRFRKKPKLA